MIYLQTLVQAQQEMGSSWDVHWESVWETLDC